MAGDGIQAIEFENYKAFEETQRLELAPLTLLFGRNSAGKSAVLRLPFLLKAAFQRGTSSDPLPLHVDDIRFGNSFPDLVHARLPNTEVRLAVEFSAPVMGRATARVELRAMEGALTGLTIHDRLFIDGAPSPNLRLLWDYSPSKARRSPWAGMPLRMLPAVPIGDRAISAREANSPLAILALDSLLAGAVYLGPWRAPGVSLYPTPSQPGWNVGQGGRDAPAVLYADDRFGTGGVRGLLLARVDGWFQEHLSWGLRVQHLGSGASDPAFSLLFSRSTEDGRTVEINYSELGSGTSQILPLVVALQWLAHPTHQHPDSQLIAVEQPELHLHPAAHAAVADLLVDAARTGRHRLLVETHSENLLLRVRRRVAEGLDPHLVALYWVNDDEFPAKLQRLNLDPDGYVPDWPLGVFEEDQSEARALARAMRARGGG